MERLNKRNLSTISKAYTHGGVFHADDVFSSALLELMNPDIEIVRVFNVPEDAELAFDIGGGMYDHHQEGSEVRENGVPYAAFGLLWRDLGAEFLGSEEEAGLFDQNFVQPIDLTDNTGEPNTLSSAIGSFNPTWDSDPGQADERFREAVEFAVQILINYKMRVEGKLKARTLVEEALKSSKNGIVVLPKFAPWQDVLIPAEEANFVVYPSQRGGYNLQVVPVDFGTQDAKIPLPEDWLQTAPEGCTFVHKGLFIAAFKTELDAKNAAKKAALCRVLPEFRNVTKDKASLILGNFDAIYQFANNWYGIDEIIEVALIAEHGVDMSEYVYSDPRFTKDELEEIRLGLDHGVNVLGFFGDEVLCGEAIKLVRLGLEKGFDMSGYVQFELSILEKKGDD